MNNLKHEDCLRKAEELGLNISKIKEGLRLNESYIINAVDKAHNWKFKRKGKDR